jgi:hypothetical protein
MVLSFRVKNFDAVSWLLNEFSEVLDGYSIEYCGETNKPQLLVLFIAEGLEKEAREIADLVFTLIRTLQEEVLLKKELEKKKKPRLFTSEQEKQRPEVKD